MVQNNGATWPLWFFLLLNCRCCFFWVFFAVMPLSAFKLNSFLNMRIRSQTQRRHLPIFEFSVPLLPDVKFTIRLKRRSTVELDNRDE